MTLHAVIFKDLNGNHKQDSNEEGVENMLVNVRALSVLTASEDSAQIKGTNGEDLISNHKGEIDYENIPSGIYQIKCVSLVSNGDKLDKFQLKELTA